MSGKDRGSQFFANFNHERGQFKVVGTFPYEKVFVPRGFTHDPSHFYTKLYRIWSSFSEDCVSESVRVTSLIRRSKAACVLPFLYSPSTP